MSMAPNSKQISKIKQNGAFKINVESDRLVKLQQSKKLKIKKN